MQNGMRKLRVAKSRAIAYSVFGSFLVYAIRRPPQTHRIQSVGPTTGPIDAIDHSKRPKYVPLTEGEYGRVNNEPPEEKIHKRSKRLGGCTEWPLTYAIVDENKSFTTAHIFAELGRLGVHGVMLQEPIHLQLGNDPRCHEGCGQLGLIVAHAAIWKDIVVRNVSYALILEDDVVFHDAVCSNMDEIKGEIDEDWEVAYLGWMPRAGEQVHTRLIRGGVAPWTTHAYFITKAGAQRLLGIATYFFHQADFSHLVDPQHVGDARDQSWNALLSQTTSEWPKSMLKIDFLMISAYNFFISDEEKARWLLLGSAQAHQVMGVNWTGMADWQGGRECHDRRQKLRDGKFCKCNEWKQKECYCNVNRDDELRLFDLPLLGAGLAFQHGCDEDNVEHFPRWFDSFSEKMETCLVPNTASFMLSSVSPQCPSTGQSRACTWLGKTFSGLDLWSTQLVHLESFEMTEFRVHHIPCRSPGSENLKCCHHNNIFIRPQATDFAVAKQVLLDHEFGFLMKGLGHIPADTFSTQNIKYILDAGGNCGISALFFASIYPDATIITVEANPANFAVLKRNVAAFKNVHAVNKGLWDKSTHLRIQRGRHGREWDFQVVEAEEHEEDSIPAISIDDLLRDFKLPRFDLIKMDIEGSEKEVFESKTVASWLSNVRVFLAELHPDMRKGSDQAVRKHLRTNTYIELHQGEYEVYIRKDMS